MELPKSLPDFFQHAVNVIYAVVIAFSFNISRKIVIPFENIPSHIISTEILILGYFIVVTGWIGYFLAIKKQPHRGILGIGRFGIDLFILYLFYYLVNLADPKNMQYRQDVFIIILPVTYSVYLLWDVVRHYEYELQKSSFVTKRKAKRWIEITVDYLIIFFFLALIYYSWLSTSTADTIKYSIFFVTSMVFTGMYRHAKWKEMEPQKRSKP